MAKKKILELRDLRNYWDQETIVLYCQECKVETTTFIIDANPPNIKHRFSGNNFTTNHVKPYILHQDCQKPLVLQEKKDGKYYDIMKERLLKIDRDPIPLPSIEKPTSLFDAELKIKQLDISLERSIHEHAFKYGCYFAWVKKQVFGKFGRWVEVFTRWSQKTVERYMAFADECIKADQLLIYRPSAAKIDSMTNLPEPDPETGTPALDAMLDAPPEVEPRPIPFIWSFDWAIEKIKRAWMEAIELRGVDDREVVLAALKEIVQGEEKAIEVMRSPQPPREQMDGSFKEWVGVDDEEHEPPLTDEKIIKIFNEIEV